MRAMSWLFFTWSLKSTRISVILPDTCVPTCTVVTALNVPVADTAASRSPRSIVAKR